MEIKRGNVQAGIESHDHPFRQRIPFYKSVKGISPFAHGVPGMENGATEQSVQFKPQKKDKNR